MAGPIKVLVVDDSAFVRKVLREILGASPRIQVVDTAKDGLEALEKIAALKPDLIVDIGNVDGSFKSLAERVQQQSGIPYVLLDGLLDSVGATYRADAAASRARGPSMLGRNAVSNPISGRNEQTR